MYNPLDVADWYYIGHYGQLGPLTREQVDELVAGGVITRETFVWRSGMSQWQAAEMVRELDESFRLADPYTAPPPPPPLVQTPPPSQQRSMSPQPVQFQSQQQTAWAPNPYGGSFLTVKSDRSRLLAGILQLLLPGVGRLYLGYAAYGTIQLVLALLTCGIGWIWSFIDGLVILANGLKLDGYGRLLDE